MSPPTVSLAFLGCGAATRTHSGVLSRFGGEVSRYYASRDPKAADEYSRKYGGAGAFGSYAEAMADPRVQAIVVATPPDSHLDLTLAALRGRKARGGGEAGLSPRRGLRGGARRGGPERAQAHGGGELLLQAGRPGAARADRLGRAGRGAVLPPGRGEEPAAGRLARRSRDRGRRRAVRGRRALDRPAGQRRPGGGVGAGVPAGPRRRAGAQHAGGGASTGRAG